MKKQSRAEKIKEAKANFKTTMQKKYADFTEKKWAQTTYRFNHPQGLTN